MAISLKRRNQTRSRPDSMTLTEHLTELRRRVLVCAVAFLVAAVVAFIAYNPILAFLKAPYCQVAGAHRCGFYITGPLDGLALRVKISAYGGLFAASPVLLWELWRFITPGLNPKEKKYAIPFIVASITLFALGCLVAYETFPHALRFLDSVGGPSLTQILDPTKYLSLIVLLMTVFGLTFEFPVLLVSLEVAGVLTPKQLSSWRRWAIVLIVVLAGVITPSSDPFSMMALAIPLYVFYEASIVVGKILNR
ncbi:MAG TPA: twin-arginine translocase subunit TatC [Acidimicrobiales bacterium]|jgi:sec-independent protein translocase protein TatC